MKDWVDNFVNPIFFSIFAKKLEQYICIYLDIYIGIKMIDK